MAPVGDARRRRPSWPGWSACRISARSWWRWLVDAIARYRDRHRIRRRITRWVQVNGLHGEIETLSKARGRVDNDLYCIANWSPPAGAGSFLERMIVVMHQPAY